MGSSRDPTSDDLRRAFRRAFETCGDKPRTNIMLMKGELDGVLDAPGDDLVATFILAAELWSPGTSPKTLTLDIMVYGGGGPLPDYMEMAVDVACR